MSAHGLITWLIIGLIAGALAGRVVEGGGFGCLLNTVVGLAGAVIGGLIVATLAPSTNLEPGGVIRDIVVAFVGAVLLLGLLRLLTPGRRRGGPWRQYLRK
jgi:uncharacterized membrane protein YeaQ/YmgE (transglycosylase-associated protein family)